MKKLIVLTVILGLSTVANAGLVATNPVATGNVTWDVIGDQLVGYNPTGTADAQGYAVWKGDGNVTVTPLGVVDQTGSYTDSLVPNTPPYNAGGMASVLDMGPAWGANCGQATGGYLPIAGDWYVFDLSLVPGTTGLIDLFNLEEGMTPVGTLEVVPEPATIALLGLGGLLLRRRK